MNFAAWLTLYFCAQALCNFLGWTTYAFFGPGVFYGWVFATTTAMVLATCVGMAWESLWDRKYKLRIVAMAFLISGALCRHIFVNLGHRATWVDWLVLGEAVVLLWAGTIVIAMAAFRYRWIALTLGIYWLLRGGWDLAYLLNYPHWAPLNPYVPLASNLVALAIVARLAFLPKRRSA